MKIKPAVACIAIVGGALYAGCAADEPTADDDDASAATSGTGGSTAASGGGSTTSSAAGGMGGSGGEGGTPALCGGGEDADCVSCAAETCAAPEGCCGDIGSLACSATCEESIDLACDGGEDCGGSCCTTVYLDANGTGEVNGASSSCEETCDVSAASGSSRRISSVACRTGADCGGVVDGFGVPYPACCFGNGLDIGVCSSTTDESYTFPAGACQ